MGMLKRSSATRLVGWFSLAGVLVVAISVTAFAVTRSGAPTPPKRSLAAAVHVALSGRPVAGVSAQFAIDEHLLSGSSSAISVSPLAGATGSVWAGGGRVRVEIHSQRGTTEIAYDGHQVTLYDPSHHVAYVLPIARPEARPGGEAKADHPAVPTIVAIDRALGRLGRQAVLSGAIPSNIAGREAYVVRVSPATTAAWSARSSSRGMLRTAYRCGSRSIRAGRTPPPSR